MSDIREHTDTSTRGRLLNLARSEAVTSNEGHSYLPKSLKESERFIPQAWVMRAIERSYEMGLQEGAEDARTNIRLALGVRAGW